VFGVLFINDKHQAASILRAPPESALLDRDNNTVLAGEETCHAVIEWLEALLLDWRETGYCRSLEIYATMTSHV
jgi:hypothetical protein